MHAQKGMGYVGIERVELILYYRELPLYNGWQLHMIHAQKGHGYVRLQLGCVIFYQTRDTPYIVASYTSKLRSI